MSKAVKRTTSSPQKPTRPAADRSRAVHKVWRIYRFRERFEPPENVRKCRKSGLDFTRDYVGLSAGNEAVGYQQQLAMLSNGDGLEYSLLFGVYRQLVNHAGQRSRAYRGYLLNAGNEPLSDSDIGRLLKIHAKTITRMLRKLERAGLLERTSMPVEWDLSQDELPPKETDEQEDAGALDGKKQRTRTKNKGVSGDGRTSAEKDGDGQQPLKEDGKTASGKGNKKATVGLTASGSQEKEIDNGKDDPQGKANEQAPCPPTTPEPLPSEPQESDEREGPVTPTASFPPSLSQGQSSHGLGYRRRVYLGLAYHHDVDTIEARREITSFASKHDQVVSALAALSPPAVDALLARGLAEAVKIGKRKGNRNKGAVWHTVMDKLTAAAQQRSPPEKACKPV